MNQYRVVYVEWSGPSADHPGPWYADSIQEARDKIAWLMDQDLRPELAGVAVDNPMEPEWVATEAWCETTEELSPFYIIEVYDPG